MDQSPKGFIAEEMASPLRTCRRFLLELQLIVTDAGLGSKAFAKLQSVRHFFAWSRDGAAQRTKARFYDGVLSIGKSRCRIGQEL
jgi:hypothetical protein